MELDKIFKDLPLVKKEIAKAYMYNTKNIRKTLEVVLERDLLDKENNRVRLLCYDLAITQVADIMVKDYGLDELQKDEAREVIKALLSEEHKE